MKKYLFQTALNAFYFEEIVWWPVTVLLAAHLEILVILASTFRLHGTQEQPQKVKKKGYDALQPQNTMLGKYGSFLMELPRWRMKISSRPFYELVSH